jgi:hypothetical protein
METSMAMAKATGALMLAAGLGIGCTMNPVPVDQLALARQAVAAARQAGASEAAPHDLRLAEEKVRLGERWIAARDYEPARWLVEQAVVDAEVAGLKAMSARARQAAATQTQELRSRNAKITQRTD